MMVELVGAAAAASGKLIAERNAMNLCVIVYRQEKIAHRYAMPTEGLPQLTELSSLAVEAAINAALDRDWVWRTPKYLVLTATGIHVVKVSLGLY
jgi:hypothetical protein